MKCDLCGNLLIANDKEVRPCQTCQDGAYANGYNIGYEDAQKGKPKKSNTDLVNGKRV